MNPSQPILTQSLLTLTVLGKPLHHAGYREDGWELDVITFGAIDDATDAAERRSIGFICDLITGRESKTGAEALAEHASVANLKNLAEMLHRIRRDYERASVTRVGRRGSTVTITINDNDRLHDWVFDMDRDGRVAAFVSARHIEGVTFQVGPPRGLSENDRADLRRLFALAYTNSDPSYLDAQLDALDVAAIARRDGEVVGFLVRGLQMIETERLGRIAVGLPGLMCVSPAEQRSGIGEALGNRAAWPLFIEKGNQDAAALRLATPASLAMVVKQQPAFTWPTTDDLWALYDRPTPVQVEFADLAARAHGGKGYDPATGACIGLGHPIGVPNVEPDVPDEFLERFAAIDRDRGDTLLYVRWMAEPPPLWFEV